MSIPKEIINYIFTFIQSNTNQIMKHHINHVNTHNFEKESNMYYFLCIQKCKHSCSLCSETNIPNSFKLYSIYDKKLDFYKYSAYEMIFCSEVCLNLWWTY